MAWRSLVLALVAGVLLASACRPKPATLLTVADVEKIAGRPGIHTVAGAEGRSDEVQFAGRDNRVILTVSVQAASELTQLKSRPMYFRGPVSGIGEEAMEGPRFGFPMYVYVRKGRATVAVLTYAQPDSGEDAPLLSRDQLIALARIAASRM